MRALIVVLSLCIFARCVGLAQAQSLKPLEDSVTDKYKTLLVRSGSERASTVLIQQAWLQERDRLCKGLTICLQEQDELRLEALQTAISATLEIGSASTLKALYVGEAFSLIPEMPHAAINIFRRYDTPKSKLGLALTLRLMTPRRHQAEIRDLLEQVTATAPGLPIEQSPYYDGTVSSLVPFITKYGVEVTLSCRLIERFPKLIDALDQQFWSNMDNFLPSTQCSRWDFPIPANVSAFSRAVHAYDGDAFDRCTGSLKYGYGRQAMHDDVEREVLPRALLHKAAVEAASSWTHFDETPLLHWSFEGPWNRRAYLRLRWRFTSARRDLAAYYRHRFGLAPAPAFRAAHIGLWLGLQEWAWQPEKANALSVAIMDPSAKPSLATLLASHRQLDVSRPEPLLSLAVAHPASIAPLLAAGAPVEAVNAMGKTALMQAAQFDQPNAVRQLLQAGASVDTASFAPRKIAGNDPRDPESQWSGCGFYAITHGQRTALMYAAANASLPVIKLLLAAGADRSLQDSQGSTALDYMLGHGPVPPNPSLAGAALAKAKMLLSGSSHDSAEQR